MSNLYSKVENKIPKVIDWEPTPEQEVYKHASNVLIAPILQLYGAPESKYPFLNMFSLQNKDAYRKEKMRIHLCKYLNYFNTYYDTDQSLLIAYGKIKVMTDYYTDEYDIEAFKQDIKQLILSPSMMLKVDLLNRDNFSLDLKFNTDMEVLAYDESHGKVLMKASMFMKMIIPIMTHYISKNSERIPHVHDFIISIYYLIFNAFNMDIISKMYETANKIVDKSKKSNQVIWNMQDIRGVDSLTQITESLEQIIYNLMPRYDYAQNIISFNHKSLIKNLEYNVIFNKYEFEFKQHQPSIGNGSEDDEDRFEDSLAKQDQSLLLQLNFNYKHVLKRLEMKYGPLDRNEIEFFIKELSDEDGHFILNPIQKELIFLYFDKYFDDPNGIIGNRDDYIKMMLIMKKMLLATNNMIILPYVLTGKIKRSFNKTSLKKSEREKIKKSRYYPLLQDKYRNEKHMNRIEAIISTIITLKVDFISYDEPELHGKKIPLKPELLVEEVLQFILSI